MIKDTGSESRKLVVEWVTRVVLGLVLILGFFLKDTLNQVRASNARTNEKVDLLENLLIEVTKDSERNAERYSELLRQIDKIDTKLESLR